MVLTGETNQSPKQTAVAESFAFGSVDSVTENTSERFLMNNSLKQRV